MKTNSGAEKHEPWKGQNLLPVESCLYVRIELGAKFVSIFGSGD